MVSAKPTLRAGAKEGTVAEMGKTETRGADANGGGNGAGRRQPDDLRSFDPHRDGGRSDDANAFMADPGDGPAHIDDDFAESYAEDFVRAATTGQELGDESADAMVEEEFGGPFVQTSATEEFGEFSSVPPENLPDDWAREALPQAVSGLVETPRYEDGTTTESDDDDDVASFADDGDDGAAVARAEAEDYTGPNPPHRPSRTNVEHAGRR